MASRHARRAIIGEYIPVEIKVIASSRTQLNTVPSAGSVLDFGHGMFLGSVVINDPGSAMVLTLFNGTSGPSIATIKPTAPVSLDFGCALDDGLWFTYTGTTAGSVTLNVLPVAA